MVRFVKANSSRWLKERPDLARGFSWQNGFAAFSVSESRAQAVKAYIRNQERHHTQQTFGEEIEILLHGHSIAFDPVQLRA